MSDAAAAIGKIDPEPSEHSRNFREMTSRPVSRAAMAITVALQIAYLILLLAVCRPGNPVLFIPLIVSGFFHLWQLAGFCHTVMGLRTVPDADESFTPEVDLFVTWAGENTEILRETLLAATRQDYPKYRVHLLNDGYACGAVNWREAEDVARQLGVNCITRTSRKGAKADNINHALKQTGSPFVAILDADHVPHPLFLRSLVAYAAEPDVALVQSPQYYRNRDDGPVAGGAWEQQELFFRAVMNGKSNSNSAFFCGTNALLRRSALDDAGGLIEDNIAEDFATSVRLHARGWKTVYVPQVLALGLGPEDLRSYYRQQLRWSRGSLAVLLDPVVWSAGGLTSAQRFQYWTSISYYATGLFTMIDFSVPLLSLYTGSRAFEGPGDALTLIFLVMMIAAARLLSAASAKTLTFRAISFTLSGFAIQALAAVSLPFAKRGAFHVTPKREHIKQAWWVMAPHWLCAYAVGSAAAWAWHREGLNAFVCVNALWALAYVAMFAPFVAGGFERTARRR